MRIKLNFRTVQASIAFEKAGVRTRMTIALPGHMRLVQGMLTYPIAARAKMLLERERLQRATIRTDSAVAYIGTIKKRTLRTLENFLPKRA